MTDDNNEQTTLQEARDNEDASTLLQLERTAAGPDTRQAAAAALEELLKARPEAFERATRQADAPYVRREALRRLAMIHPARAAAPAAALLHDPDADVRQEAANAITWVARAGCDVIPLVEQALQDPEERIRKTAVASLQHVAASQPERVAALLARVLTDETPAVRRSVAFQIDHLAGYDARTLLRPLFDDPDRWVRCQACHMAGKLDTTDSLPWLARALADPDESVRENAAAALAGRGDRGDPNLETLLAFLVRHSDPRFRRGGVDVVARGSGRWGVPLLVEGLFTLGAECDLSSAVFRLSHSHYPHRAAALARLLKHPEPSARAAAAGGLAKIPRVFDGQMVADVQEDEVEPIVAALTEALGDEAENVRVVSANALSSYGPAAVGAVPALIERLDDDSPAVRSRAVVALAAIGTDPVFSALVTALQDPDRTVRGYAAMELGKLGDTQAVPALVATLDGEPDSSHASVLQALAALPDPRAIDPLLAYQGPYRQQAIVALERIRASGVVPDHAAGAGTPGIRLLHLLDDLQEDVIQNADTDIDGRSERAALALAGMGALAVEPLIAMLPRSTDAHLALGRIGGERAYQALVAELQAGNWRRVAAAARALGTMGDNRAVRLLEPLLDDPGAEVHRAVTEALARLGRPAAAAAAPGAPPQVDRSDPYAQVKRVWVDLNADRTHPQRLPARIAWHRAFVAAMPTLPFDSDRERGHTWAMLGTLIYYYENPDRSTIDRPCPQAAHCYAECLKYTPERDDVAEYLALVGGGETVDSAPQPAREKPPSPSQGEGRGEGPIAQWSERLLDLVEQAVAANTLDVGRAEARRIGEEINAQGGFELMREVAHRTRDLGRQRGQRYALGYVERWWNGIGEWRA